MKQELQGINNDRFNFVKSGVTEYYVIQEKNNMPKGLLALAEIKKGVLNNKKKWNIAADKINQDEMERLRKHAEEVKIMTIYNNCSVIPPMFTRYVGGTK